MDCEAFIKNTVLTLSDGAYEHLKELLVEEYLTFAVLDDSEITKSILAEKIYDYFEKLELKTGRDFAKNCSSYIGNLDAIVGHCIAKIPQTKKKDAEPMVVPRARKYYEKALSIKSARTMSVRQLLDYTRLMMCLYMAVINKRHAEINDLDYSVSCLNIELIIENMKNEPDPLIKIGGKKRFDIKELYCADTCTFILAIIALIKITDDRIQGDYYHE